MGTGDREIESSVRQWVETVVVGLDLCPFAGRELQNDRVRFAVSHARSEDRLLADLNAELTLLTADDAIETTLLIHPDVLQAFDDYNQFLDMADLLIEQSGNSGIFQVASFHPDYQFDGTNVNDAENFTNRSPHPILHILREASLERAIESYPDVADIPERNIRKMNELGGEKVQVLFNACLRPPGGNG